MGWRIYSVEVFRKRLLWRGISAGKTLCRAWQWNWPGGHGCVAARRSSHIDWPRRLSGGDSSECSTQHGKTVQRAPIAAIVYDWRLPSELGNGRWGSDPDWTDIRQRGRDWRHCCVWSSVLTRTCWNSTQNLVLFVRRHNRGVFVLQTPWSWRREVLVSPPTIRVRVHTDQPALLARGVLAVTVHCISYY